MSKKVFALVVGITGGVAAVASALVSFFKPAYETAIIAGIDVAATAVIEICGLFIAKEKA